MLSLHSLRSGVAEYRHHVQEIFEGAVAVLTGAKDLADPVAKGIHSQFGILQDLGHWQLRVFVVSNFLWGECLELLMRAIERRTYIIPYIIINIINIINYSKRCILTVGLPS